MNWKFIFCISLGLLLTGQTFAQKKMSWRKRARIAEKHEEQGKLGQAAVLYYSVFEEKADKYEYAYKAGMCYYQMRDYRGASRCLEPLKDMNGEYDKPGFYYALALKQQGQYEEAQSAFQRFLSQYQGEHAGDVAAQVETEILGCQFGLQAENNTDPSVSVEHLDARINSDQTESAPIPFADGVFYFTSIRGGSAKIYRTQKEGKTWKMPEEPSLFQGVMEKNHYGNGSFTPDGNRFYFTQCAFDEEVGKIQCGIYVMEQKESKWGAPIRLADYINVEGSNTTHPFVTIVGEKEVLYFASDREGGKGGLDIWYCMRTVGSRGNNFTLPQNLGRNINTPGDEITPFYDPEEQTLYFSSNGRVSAGGWDIFKSRGERYRWEVPKNLGFPINSAADDLYYTPSEAHGGGYFVSNRIYSPSRVSTTDDDIFSFGQKIIRVTLNGKIYLEDNNDGEVAEDVMVRLFELKEGEQELIEERMLAYAEYSFDLQPQRHYILEFLKKGYNAESIEFLTKNFKRTQSQEKDITLYLPQRPDRDPRWAIVPPSCDVASAGCLVPEEMPIDPDTGTPYEEGTPEYDAYYEAMAIAERSDNQKVFYNEFGELVPAKPTSIAAVTPPETVAPAANNTEETPYETPENTSFEEETLSHQNFPEEAYEADGCYRIQLAAVKRYKGYRYDEAAKLGQLLQEEIGGGITRVILVPETENGECLGYASKGEALDRLALIFDLTRFDRAFVIKYEDGQRVGKGFRGLEPESGTEEIADIPQIEVPRNQPEAAYTSDGCYRIQLAAVKRYKGYRYDEAAKHGRLLTEELPNGMTRVLLVPFSSPDACTGFASKGEALDVLQNIASQTRFERAFVVQYEADTRVGDGFRDFEE